MVFKDKLVAGTIAGIIANAIHLLTNFFWYRIGVAKYTYIQLAASALLKKTDVYTFSGHIVGFFSDLIMGGLLGILAIMVLTKFGFDYWWLKGLFFGGVIWLFGAGVILNLGTVSIVPQDIGFRLTSLMDHLIFGVITSFLSIRLFPNFRTR